MNKKASAMIEVMILLVTIVLTSGVVLLLVNSGILTVRADSEPLLNTEFIPLGRTGSLVITEFDFCSSIIEYDCSPSEVFKLGDEVHFKFIVESSTYNGDVSIVENYRVKSPEGKVLLDVDLKDNYYFDVKSNKELEKITFKDYFVVGSELPNGVYTLELVIQNPLIDKRATLAREFVMTE